MHGGLAKKFMICPVLLNGSCFNECNWLSDAGSSLLTGPEGLSMKERENLRKLKALRRYRRRYGVEALLHRQLRERRQAITEGGTAQVHLLV